MHDMSVAKMVAEEVVSKLEGKKPEKISVEMDVGSLRFHDTSQVEFWIKELLHAELGKKVKVNASINKLRSEIKCSCGFEGKPNEKENNHELLHQGIFTMKCPNCGSDEYELVQGNEVVLKKIEFS